MLCPIKWDRSGKFQNIIKIEITAHINIFPDSFNIQKVVTWPPAFSYFILKSNWTFSAKFACRGTNAGPTSVTACLNEMNLLCLVAAVTSPLSPPFISAESAHQSAGASLGWNYTVIVSSPSCPDLIARLGPRLRLPDPARLLWGQKARAQWFINLRCVSWSGAWRGTHTWFPSEEGETWARHTSVSVSDGLGAPKLVTLAVWPSGGHTGQSLEYFSKYWISGLFWEYQNANFSIWSIWTKQVKLNVGFLTIHCEFW